MLVCTQETLVQSPAPHEAGMTVHACNPSTEELETEGSEV